MNPNSIMQPKCDESNHKHSVKQSRKATKTIPDHIGIIFIRWTAHQRIEIESALLLVSFHGNMEPKSPLRAVWLVRAYRDISPLMIQPHWAMFKYADIQTLPVTWTFTCMFEFPMMLVFQYTKQKSASRLMEDSIYRWSVRHDYI